MSITVRLHVFSGRPNPVWSLTVDQAQELRKAIEKNPPKSRSTVRGLGYRGFSILEPEADEKIKPMLSETFGSDEHIGTLISSSPELEEYLLWTGQNNISDDIVTHVRNAILSEADVPLLKSSSSGASCPSCHGNDAPGYNPQYWNDNPTRLRSNNCYNYANNQATNTFAQPGRGSGQMFTQLVCNDVCSAAERDGLAPKPSFNVSVPGWYVALVIWPKTDYHWYRQDNTGCWSHKPGEGLVRDVDDSGAPITDPQTADRGPYTVFCTYMSTSKSVTIT